MTFYEEIAHRLFVWKTEIGDTKFFDPFEFIEEKHKEARFKGPVFYQNLMRALPNHFGAKLRNGFFVEVLQYCKRKIDELKTEKANCKYRNFSANNELSYYRDEKNIPSQDLVNQTIEYFEKGDGARAFKPLEFLNLLWEQYNFINSNIDDHQKIFSTLGRIPLNQLERHILYGFIIKWFGGYPLEAPLGIDNSELHYQVRKLLLEKFLSYEGETPEKEFCKVNFENRARASKLSIALTAFVNNSDVDLAQLLDAMQWTNGEKDHFDSFDKIFDHACREGLVGGFENNQRYLVERSKHNFEFDAWLMRFKDWEYGNNSQYKMFLTKQNFLEYLKYHHTKNDTDSFFYKAGGDGYRLFQDNYNKLAERFRVRTRATREDCEIHPRLKVGDIIEFNPDYKTSIEAFTLLTRYYAAQYCELEKHLFIQKYKTTNEETITGEIKEIEKFVYQAEKMSYSDACAAFGYWDRDKPEFVYRRLRGGFYENLEIHKYPSISAVGNREAAVYGRYFLFYDYLKSQLKNDFDFSAKDSERALHEFMDDLARIDARQTQELRRGFDRLEQYVIENVFDDIKAELPRVLQVKENLLRWKGKLRSVFIDPENQDHLDLELFNAWKQIAQRMEGKIITALEILDLRASRKENRAEHYQKTKEIYIAENVVDQLYGALHPKFQNPELLIKVLRGEKIDNPIQFKFKARVLCQIFKFLHEKSLISNTEEETQYWLVRNVLITEKGRPKKLQASTVSQYFKLRQINEPVSELSFLNKP